MHVIKGLCSFGSNTTAGTAAKSFILSRVYFFGTGLLKNERLYGLQPFKIFYAVTITFSKSVNGSWVAGSVKYNASVPLDSLPDVVFKILLHFRRLHNLTIKAPI